MSGVDGAAKELAPTQEVIPKIGTIGAVKAQREQVLQRLQQPQQSEQPNAAERTRMLKWQLNMLGHMIHHQETRIQSGEVNRQEDMTPAQQAAQMSANQAVVSVDRWLQQRYARLDERPQGQELDRLQRDIKYAEDLKAHLVQEANRSGQEALPDDDNPNTGFAGIESNNKRDVPALREGDKPIESLERVAGVESHAPETLSPEIQELIDRTRAEGFGVTYGNGDLLGVEEHRGDFRFGQFFSPPKSNLDARQMHLPINNTTNMEQRDFVMGPFVGDGIPEGYYYISYSIPTMDEMTRPSSLSVSVAVPRNIAERLLVALQGDVHAMDNYITGLFPGVAVNKTRMQTPYGDEIDRVRDVNALHIEQRNTTGVMVQQSTVQYDTR